MRVARRFRGGLIKSRSEAEKAFEELLKMMRIHFVRQAIFLDSSRFFIVDFLIKGRRRLAVEIDGLNHRNKKKQQTRDRLREQCFQKLKQPLIRFSNEEVLSDPDSVRDRLATELGLAS